MRIFLRVLLAVGVLMAAAPAVTSAGIFRRCEPRSCRRCTRPVINCCCPAAIPAATVVPQTTMVPVTETQYVQQPIMTQRDVVETQYRNEAFTTTVPKTVFDTVTVDEGSYQQVWVPRVVQKQVSRTIYEQQTAYRQVPYQYTRRVSEVQMQTVPRQTVRYVPSTTGYTTVMNGGSMLMGSSMQTGTVFNSPTMVTGSTFATPTFATPAFSATPAPSAVPASMIGNTALSPDPRFSSTNYSPVTPQGIETDSGLVPAPADSPIMPRNTLNDRGTTTTSRSSMFAPAPSAASAWRAASRGTFSR